MSDIRHALEDMEMSDSGRTVGDDMATRVGAVRTSDLPDTCPKCGYYPCTSLAPPSDQRKCDRCGVRYMNVVLDKSGKRDKIVLEYGEPAKGHDAFDRADAEIRRGMEETRIPQPVNKPDLREPALVPPTANKTFLALLDEVRRVHIAKSHDYGTNNLRAAADFGVPAYVGVWLRMNDKMERLKTFARTGSLKNEGVKDTLMDLANYSLLALTIMLEDEANKERS